MSSDDILERSLRLLEEAFNSPSSQLITSHTVASMANRNKRASLGGESMFLDATHNVGKIRKADINLSITLSPDEISQLCDVNDTQASVPSDVSGMYQRFQEIFQMYGTTQQVFEAVSNFIETCSLMVDTLSNVRSFIDKTREDLLWLRCEVNTWRLVYGLYRDRLLHQDDEDMADIDDTLLACTHPTSEKDIMINLYKNDSSVRECQVMIDWLERISSDEWRASVAHFTDRTVGWENTLHQLHNSVIPYMSSRDIVTSLDPDAPNRENKPLHDLDLEDEERLLEQVFCEMRCGRLDKAEELCVHCGQAWRGAVLEGWRLHHDPNYTNKTVSSGGSIVKLPIEGNPHRDVWKLCAWRVCEDQAAHPRERAIMASLCGHLDALLPACLSWEDLLWAYLRAIVDRRVERHIRDNASRQYIPMPDKYWDLSLNLEDVFTEIRANELAKEEAKKPDRVIQELIALDLIPELLKEMVSWVENETCSPQFLRFLAHLVIILRLVGRGQPHQLGDAVITAYIKVLMNEGDPNLIAFYVAMMPEENQTELYASFMETITNAEKRIECLNAAESCELNVKRITETVVHNIRNRKMEAEESEDILARKATDEDYAKISALDWVVYYPQQRAEAIWQANALIRSFVGQGKLQEAREAFQKIPLNSIELVMNQFKCKIDEHKRVKTDNLPPKVAAAIKEYLCHKAYLDGQDGFSEWFRLFHNSKPSPPAEPANKDDFAEKIAHGHKMSVYNEELERWTSIMKHQTKSVKAQLYNVILFPDGGWLVDNYAEDQSRVNHLKSLRSLCIPQTVMLLLTVLHNMEEYDECIDLAPLIVDENLGLYKVFTRDQCKDLLVKICESSKKLLELHEDPYGAFSPEDNDEEEEVRNASDENEIELGIAAGPSQPQQLEDSSSS